MRLVAGKAFRALQSGAALGAQRGEPLHLQGAMACKGHPQMVVAAIGVVKGCAGASNAKNFVYMKHLNI